MALFILDKTDRAAVMPLGKPSTGPIATYYIHYISTVLLIIRNVYITGLGQDENTGILHRREVFRGICDGLRASTLKKGRFCVLRARQEAEPKSEVISSSTSDTPLSIPLNTMGQSKYCKPAVLFFTFPPSKFKVYSQELLRNSHLLPE